MIQVVIHNRFHVLLLVFRVLLLTEEILQVEQKCLRGCLGIVVVPPDPPESMLALFCAGRGGRPKRENIASRLRADRCPSLNERGSGGDPGQHGRWQALLQRRFMGCNLLAILFPSTV